MYRRFFSLSLWVVAIGALAVLRPVDARAHDILANNGAVADPEGNPNEPLGMCGDPPEEARPILLDTGEFMLLPSELTTPDLVVPVRGLTIDLRRTYRTGYAYPGVLGFGWEMATNRRLRQLDNGDLVITSGTCRTATYTFNGVGWDAPEGVARTLIQESDGTYLETAKDGLSHRFDSNGSLTATRDRHGNRLLFFYSPDRRPIFGRSRFFTDATSRIVAYEFQLLRIEDPVGREVVFAYDSEGRVAQISDWIGRTWSYAYDSFGNLTGVTAPPTGRFPAGATTTYRYEDARFPHKMTGLVAPNEQPAGPERLRNVYDDEGRVVRQEDGAGGVFQFTYQTDRTVVVDPNGTTSTFEYANRRLTGVTVSTRGVRSPSEEPVGTEYARGVEYANERRTALVAADGVRVEQVFDFSNPDVFARSNLLEVRTSPIPGSTDPTLVTRYTYKTPYHQIGTVEDRAGNVTEFFYDQNHNLERIERPAVPEGTPTELYVYDQFGLLVSSTDANGVTTARVYDENGYLERRIDAVGTPEESTIEFGPDSVGRPTIIEDGNGNATMLEYDSWNRLERIVQPAPFLYEAVFEYDANGRVIRIARQSEVPGDPQTTTFGYDILDRVVSLTNELGEATTYGYDPNGNQNSVTDAEGNTVSRVFDERNLLYLERAANGNEVRIRYHAGEQLAAIADGLSRETLYGYDDYGRWSRVDYADGTFEERVLDAAGTIERLTTRAGVALLFDYDALDRLRTRTGPDEVSAFTYDLGGRMTSAQNEVATLAFEYDARNRISRERAQVGGQPESIVEYDFDPVGNRTRLVYPGGDSVEYSYDELDRMTAVRIGGGMQLSSWSYDELSRMLTRELPSGVQSTWSYDRAGRVGSIAHVSGAGAVVSEVYGRDATGVLRTVDDARGRRVYSYDASDQLLSVDYPGGSAFPDWATTYDEAGNRLDETVTSGTVSYATNALNQYTGVGSDTFTYDLNGNLVSDATSTYGFDSLSRLASVQTSGGDQVTFDYDPFMRRVRKVVNGSETVFVWGGNFLLEERPGSGGPRTRYVYGAGLGPAHVQIDSTVYDVHEDQLGSANLITDAAGSVAWQAELSAFGQAAVDPLSQIAFNLRFPGQYEDVETGLYYNRFRYYSPALGRYVSVDPLGQKFRSLSPMVLLAEMIRGAFRGGGNAQVPWVVDTNTLAYVRNTPTGFTDFLGLDEDTLLGDARVGKRELCRRKYADECTPGSGCYDPGLCEARVANCVRTFTMEGTGGALTNLPTGGGGGGAVRRAWELLDDLANLVTSIFTNSTDEDDPEVEPSEEEDGECEDGECP